MSKIVISIAIWILILKCLKILLVKWDTSTLYSDHSREIIDYRLYNFQNWWDAVEEILSCLSCSELHFWIFLASPSSRSRLCCKLIAIFYPRMREWWSASSGGMRVMREIQGMLASVNPRNKRELTSKVGPRESVFSWRIGISKHAASKSCFTAKRTWISETYWIEMGPYGSRLNEISSVY
jgi:hypothetical protein